MTTLDNLPDNDNVFKMHMISFSGIDLSEKYPTEQIERVRKENPGCDVFYNRSAGTIEIHDPEINAAARMLSILNPNKK